MLLISFLSFYFHSRSFAAPTGIEVLKRAKVNGTSTSGKRNGTVGWVEAPQVRGTFDLLMSCLTTLSLCAWTAYHPNINATATEFQRFRHRTFWMITAILFPELVLFCAWQQWWAARRFQKEINSIGDAAYDGEVFDELREKIKGGTFCGACSKEKDVDSMSIEPERAGSNSSRMSNDSTSPNSSRYDLEELFSSVHSTDSSTYDLNFLFDEQQESHGLPQDNAISETPHSHPNSPAPSSSPSNTSLNSTSDPENPPISHPYYSNTPAVIQPGWDLSQAFSTLAQHSSLKTPEKFPSWTMQQAFFALSGGFAADLSSFSPRGRVTFTLNGLKLLATLGLLPLESPETVEDKSKADYVAKVLVCLQAGWFMLQCLARLIQKLPLSLLEVHVLAHVFCAFCMYFLWIRKPYDANSPILCTREEVVDLAALFALHDEQEGGESNDPRVSTATITTPSSHLPQFAFVYKLGPGLRLGHWWDIVFP